MNGRLFHAFRRHLRGSFGWCAWGGRLRITPRRLIDTTFGAGVCTRKTKPTKSKNIP